MKCDTRNLRGFEVLTVVLTCLAVQAVFTLPAYGDEIVGWGFNNYGQATPPLGNDFIAIAAGVFHSLALRADGGIVCWGVGDGVFNFGQATPPQGNDFTAIAAGAYHNLALKSDGTIVGWGRNDYGQATPPEGNDLTAFAAGWGHSIALKSDGTIVCWGRNDYGQATPPLDNDFIAIASGGWHGLALKADGSIVGWGRNDYGQATPPEGNNFTAVAAGEWHSIALKSDGSIVGWGYNNYGQAMPPAENDFTAAASDWYHGLALKSDGSIVGWGRNDRGEATPPEGTDFTAVATGVGHSLALVRQDSPPVADSGPDQTVEATSPAGASVILDGSSSTDPDSTAGTNDDIVSFDWFEGTTLLSSGETINYTFPLGSHNVTLVVTDSAGETSSDQVVIIVEDTTPPVITINGETTLTLECGIDIYEEPGATVSDICDQTVSVIIGGDIVDTSACGTYIITYDATDASGNSAIQVTRTVTIEDTLPPEIIAATVEPQVIEVGQSVDFDAVVGDECGFTVKWDFGDGNPTTTENPTTNIYDSADIYTVTLTASDSSDNVTTEEFFVVVYDISVGFVTGGGWIWSPTGALVDAPDIEGKAHFGFVSKYKKGATVPTGNTEFQFKAGDLNFHSSSYDWLVVTGSDYARFKGAGTINGSGEYKFMLWAGDSEPDTFRIRIWEEDGSGVETDIYDNGFNQEIGGGSIKIHTN